MKQEVKRLYEDFPNLLGTLTQMREVDEMSYPEIARYFQDKGYKCSRSLIERLLKGNGINIPRNVGGKNNPFYGREHSKNTKEKISNTRKEKEVAKGKRNPMYGKVGELCPSWKGGTSTRQAIFYSSTEWEEKRLEIMKLDNFTCQQCGQTASSKHGFLNVHHIVPLSSDWEKRLDKYNLITLCVDCHTKTFGKELEVMDMLQDIVRTYRRL